MTCLTLWLLWCLKAPEKNATRLKICNSVNQANIATFVESKFSLSPLHRGSHESPKGPRCLQYIMVWIATKIKITVFDVLEQQQNHLFLRSVFYWNRRCKTKSWHSQQSSVLVLGQKWYFSLFFAARTKLRPLVPRHFGLSAISNITTAMHDGK